MESVEMFESNHFVERIQCFIPGFFGADVISSSENVAGVDADANRHFFMQALNDVGEVLKSPADSRALAGCGFEKKACASFICEVLKMFEALHDLV